MISSDANLFTQRDEAIRALFLDYTVVRTPREEGGEDVIVLAPYLSHVEAHEVGLLGNARRYLASFSEDQISLQLTDATPTFPLHPKSPADHEARALLFRVFPLDLFAKMIIWTKPTWASRTTYMLGLWLLSEAEQERARDAWLGAGNQIHSVPGLVVIFVFEQPVTN